MRAFMHVECSNHSFVELEDAYYNILLVPKDVASLYIEPNGYHVSEEYTGKWFARLAAPGYLDATDWTGPFETEQEAKAYIVDLYDIDPVTGEPNETYC